MVVFWYFNWFLDGPRSHWAFFPMWFGFVLTINGLTHKSKGSSLFSSGLKSWLFLFLLSAPIWWLFEWLNKVAQYWHYIGVDSFSDVQYNLMATLSFATVIPAIFSTAEFVDCLQSLPDKGPVVGRRHRTVVLFFVLGCIMLFAFLIKPEYSAPFLWMSLFFILDPVNYWLGYKSILRETSKGNWRIVYCLWIASLICGFLWEFWNFYSFPKWIYTVPFVDFWYVFEMPMLGYLGYIPFALELYAMYHLIIGIFGD